jgi:hypothetical protein
MFILAIVALARGQTHMPKPGGSTKLQHWRKYVNKQYGFSFWYPGQYRPVPLPIPDEHGNNYAENDKGLLLLQRRATTQLLERAHEHGLLIGKGGLYGSVIRLSPMLNIGKADADEAVRILDRSFGELQS